MKLNQAQKLAVNTIEGPVMVIAGPGTGKTQIIAERIANILKKTDTPPDGILALTFTESGAKAMRQRLIDTIGETAYYVNIFTFHSFCSSVIQEFPDRFIISHEMEPLSGLERVEIFQQILDKNTFEQIKPINQPFFYTPALIKAIQDLKREGLSPKTFKSVLIQEKKDLLKSKLSKTALSDAQKQLAKNQELFKVYISYQKILKQRGRYDFEDMINLVVEAFKRDKNLLRTYQERLLYFLVDEYQDTNSAQNQVVNLLASFWGNEANVFVVCDSDQSIFRFQGASLENIISFTKTYPTTTIITLDNNYRSTQTILNASYKLIQKNHFQIQDVFKFSHQKIQLKSQKKFKESKINLIKLPSETLETYWLAQKVKKLINKGVKPEEIAVLYRHNLDASALADMFAKLSIPIDIEGGGDVLKDPLIQKLITLMKTINNSPSNLEDLDLFTLLHYEFFKFDPLDILKITRSASQKKTSIINIILSPDFNKLKLKKPEIFINFINQLTQWQQLDAQLTFSEFFEVLTKDSGLLDWIVGQSDAVEKLNRLNSLFSEIKRLNNADHQLNLNSFLKALELMEINYLKINEKDLDIKTNSVTLTTAHKAKGKEWAYVFIYKAIDGKWGNNRVRNLIKLPQSILKNTDLAKKEKNEDERRLFYVALTRAKKNVFISYAERYSTGTYIKEVVPSMFISELPQKFTKFISPSLTKAKKILVKFLEPPIKEKPRSSEKQFLKTILQNFKLSPTALNTYLACPYKFKLNNLIRVPRAKESYLSFGTAVHKALEMFHRQFIHDDKYPSQQYLLDQFQLALKKEVLTDKDYQVRIKQGKKILSAYFNHYQADFKKPLFTEKFFGYGWSKVFLGDIPLAGKVDRIDWLNQTDKTVTVIDYKTGKPKTRNQILGKTKDSEGDYYRQLVFYKLLAQLDQNFRPTVTTAELDFIEPVKENKFKKESFKIKPADIKQLRQTIQKVIKEIRAHNFSRTTDYSKCTRCEYNHHCWPKGLPSAQEQLKLVS